MEREEQEKKRFLEALWMVVETWGRDLPTRSMVKQKRPRERVINSVYSFLMILDNAHKYLPEYKLSVVDKDGSETVISGDLHEYFIGLDPLIELGRMLDEEPD